MFQNDLSQVTSIPFELWTVEPGDTHRINIAIYSGFNADTNVFQNNPNGTGYIMNRDAYIIPVYDDYDPVLAQSNPFKPFTDGDLFGWFILFDHNISIFHPGDVYQVHFSNPLIPGEDIYTFTAEGLQPISNSKEIQKQIDEINVFPNPFYFNKSNGLGDRVFFTHLGKGKSTIRIFTLAGDLVRKLEKNIYTESEADKLAVWDLENSHHRRVANGIYLVHITVTNENNKVLGEKIIKLAILN